MSILIVDDNTVNLFVIKKILKNAGYETCTSLSSAHQLFDYLERNRGQLNQEAIDLILLEIMMPEIDGIEACQRLQQDERFKDIPIL
jgi:phosphoserine phosphatase RsbU/P